MSDWRKHILGAIGVLIVVGSARAGMLPVCDPSASLRTRLDGERKLPRQVCSRMESRHADSSGRYDSSVTLDLEIEPVWLAPRAVVNDLGQTPLTSDTTDLTGGPDSCGLCLYALMGVGLCAAPHWLKKLHFGHLPEWYHDGGPSQIGHSYAATPESLCCLQVCCFAPPVEPVEPLKPQYRLGTIISLWRKSQFTPAVLASRGPPS
jgi:hypothetical protein